MIVLQRRSPGLHRYVGHRITITSRYHGWGSSLLSLSLSLSVSLSLSLSLLFFFFFFFFLNFKSQIAGYQAEFLANDFLLIRRLLLFPNRLFFHSVCVSCYLEPQLSHLRMYGVHFWLSTLSH